MKYLILFKHQDGNTPAHAVIHVGDRYYFICEECFMLMDIDDAVDVLDSHVIGD